MDRPYLRVGDVTGLTADGLIMSTCAASATAPVSPVKPSLDDPGHVDVGETLRRHLPRCLRVALQATRDHHHAKDAVQEAFLAFARDPSGYDPGRGPVGAWLAMLTHRRAVDLVRREQARPKPAPTPQVAHPDTLIDPETKAEQAVQTQHVHRLLRTLDPTKRQIIYMTYYLGYTQTQIADPNGMPLGTVKTRSRTALHQLRSILTTPSQDGAEPSHPFLLAG